MLKNVIAQIEESLHRALKVYCGLNGISIKDFVKDAITEKLKRDKKDK